MVAVLDMPLKKCPDQFVCSISLEVMVNPVKLKQTGQIYDHSSFHEWLTRGGSICPLTGNKLKNPIVLQPQSRLRSEIWRYQEQQQEARQQEAIIAQLEGRCSSASSDDESFWGSNAGIGTLSRRKEQEIQYQLARDRIPSSPADNGPKLYQTLLTWLYKRGQAIAKPKRPSTYFISHGNHVYCRGDLY